MASCSAPGTADWIDPAECGTNTPPAAGNITINSSFDGETDSWRVCFSLDWVDPGVDSTGTQGTDAPNMRGGMLSAEFTQATTPSIWLDEDLAGDGQTSGTVETGICSDEWVPPDSLLAQYPNPVDLDPADPQPDYSGCFDWNENGVAEREDCFSGAIINFAARFRDACDASSDTVNGTYRLGTGRLVESEGLTGCSEVPACPGADEL